MQLSKEDFESIRETRKRLFAGDAVADCDLKVFVKWSEIAARFLSAMGTEYWLTEKEILRISRECEGYLTKRKQADVEYYWGDDVLMVKDSNGEIRKAE
jgi:hypothetical protein